jgi:hypothetical protein
MRESTPSAVASHTLSGLVVIAPSEFAGVIGNVAFTRLVAASIRTSDLPAPFGPQIGTHTLPNPYAIPEHGTPGSFILELTVLVAAFTRSTSVSVMFAIHSALEPLVIQSGAPPMTIVVRGNSEIVGRGCMPFAA